MCLRGAQKVTISIQQHVSRRSLYLLSVRVEYICLLWIWMMIDVWQNQFQHDERRISLLDAVVIFKLSSAGAAAVSSQRGFHLTRPEGDLSRDPMCPVLKSGGPLRTPSFTFLFRRLYLKWGRALIMLHFGPKCIRRRRKKGEELALRKIRKSAHLVNTWQWTQWPLLQLDIQSGHGLVNVQQQQDFLRTSTFFLPGAAGLKERD